MGIFLPYMNFTLKRYKIFIDNLPKLKIKFRGKVANSRLKYAKVSCVNCAQVN